MGDVRVSEDVAAQVVQTAVVRPGDTLLLRIADGAPADVVRQLGALLEERLPEVKVVVVGGVDEMVIYRPEPPLYSVELSQPNADGFAKAVYEGIWQNAGRDPRRTG